MPVSARTHKPSKPGRVHRVETVQRKVVQGMYGREWRKARAIYLSEHPLCVHCKDAGRVKAAVVVDHIQPHRGDYGLFWDRGNWQALCVMHHNVKTATEDGGFGNRG